METESEIRQTIEGLQDERNTCLGTLEHVRNLLDKADERKKGNPEEARRWNRTLDNLEQSLLENKTTLTRCDSELQSWERKLEDLATSTNTQDEDELLVFDDFDGDDAISKNTGVSLEESEKKLLRGILRKCVANRLDLLTMGDCQFLVDCCGKLEQGAKQSAENEKLIEIIGTAVAHCATLAAQLNKSYKRLKP